MANLKNENRLTKREMDILDVLWSTGKPMVASEIAKTDSSLSIHTVQAVLRDLLKKKYIEIDDIVYSGTVLSRSYRPTPLAKEQTTQNFASQFKELTKNISPSTLFSALLDANEYNDEVIAELETIIREKKRAEKGE